ncbi:MAG TPA: oligosaccharide flippase family protein, partial [Bacteroidia bacterium]|nr:oligosaccharide flippase family protein [Bacteroidia bacterium]
MGIIVRQSIKSTAVVYFGVALAFLINLIIFPLCFSLEEIGLLRVLAELGGLVATFASLGLTQSVFKFFPYFNNKNTGHNGYLTFITIVSLIGISIFGILLSVFRDTFIGFYQKDSPLLSSYWYLVIPISMGILFSTLYEYYSNLHLRIVVPKIIRELILRILIIGAAFLVYSELISFLQFSWLYVLLFVLSAIFILIYLRWLGQLHFTRIIFNTEYPARQIAVFNGYILFGAFGSLLINQIDILMIAASPGGDANNGIYLTMVLIASMIELPGRSLGQISTPIIAEHMKSNNYGEVKSLYRNTSIIQLSVGCLLFTLLWSNIDNVFAMMPKGQLFQAGKWCVFYIGISQLFNMSTSVNGTILGLSKYYKFGFFATLGLGVISFCTNYLLISRY